MPDISKLPELAEIFHVTIDDLLEQNTEMVNRIVSGELDEYLEDHPVNLDELAEIAPILKPDQIDRALEGADFTNLREIVDLLPFISRTTLDDIARKAGLGALKPILPFIPKAHLKTIAEAEYDKYALEHFKIIAPFLDRDSLNRFAGKALAEKGIKAIKPVAPFIDNHCLSPRSYRASRRLYFSLVRRSISRISSLQKCSGMEQRTEWIDSIADSLASRIILRASLDGAEDRFFR